MYTWHVVRLYGYGQVERKVHYFVLDPPPSDGCFIRPYLMQTTEGFCYMHWLVYRAVAIKLAGMFCHVVTLTGLPFNT